LSAVGVDLVVGKRRLFVEPGDDGFVSAAYINAYAGVGGLCGALTRVRTHPLNKA
jgi:hypothetical protein